MKTIRSHKELILKGLFLAFGLGLTIRFASQWWDVAAHNQLPCSDCKLDFLSIYTGSHLLWNDPGRLYDLETQKSLQALLQPDQGDWLLPFVNPPLTAVFLLPLGWLTFQWAYVLMTFINVGLLAASCLMLIRGFELSADAAQWLFLFVIGNTATQVALLQGQTSLLLLFALSGVFVAWSLGQQQRAGVWLALSAIKPQAPAALLTLLLFPLTRAFLMSAVLCLTLVTGVSIAIVGYEGTTDFLRLIQQTASGGMTGIKAERMYNLRALSMYILPSGWMYLWVAMSAGLILTVWIRHRFKEETSNLLSMALAMILLTPHLFIHDLTILAIPVACLLSRCRTVSMRDALILMFLAALPFLGLNLVYKMLPVVPVGLLMVLYGTIHFRTAAPNRS